MGNRLEPGLGDRRARACDLRRFRSPTGTEAHFATRSKLTSMRVTEARIALTSSCFGLRLWGRTDSVGLPGWSSRRQLSAGHAPDADSPKAAPYQPQKHHSTDARLSAFTATAGCIPGEANFARRPSIEMAAYGLADSKQHIPPLASSSRVRSVATHHPGNTTAACSPGCREDRTISPPC